MSIFNVIENPAKLDDVSEPVTNTSPKTGLKILQNNISRMKIPETINPDEHLDSSEHRSEKLINQQLTSPSRKTIEKVKKCFKCIYDDCNFASYSDAKVSFHTGQHRLKGETYECIECNLKFVKKQSHLKHSQVHSKDSQRLIACEFPGCSKKYTTIYNRDVKIL